MLLQCTESNLNDREQQSMPEQARFDHLLQNIIYHFSYALNRALRTARLVAARGALFPLGACPQRERAGTRLL